MDILRQPRYGKASGEEKQGVISIHSSMQSNSTSVAMGTSDLSTERLARRADQGSHRSRTMAIASWTRLDSSSQHDLTSKALAFVSRSDHVLMAKRMISR